MRLFPLLTGVFLLVAGQEQKNNCSIDPDLIYFEDKDLEAFIKTLYNNGNCSAVVWKEEVVNVLKKHKKQILDMSTRDKTMLRYLISFVIKPEAERPPPDYFLYLGTLSESEIMNPLDFGSSTESTAESQDDDYISPILWKFGSDRETGSLTSAPTRRKRQLQRFPEPFRSPRDQQSEAFSFGMEFERPAMFSGRERNPGSEIAFEFGNEQQNQWNPFRYNRQEGRFSQRRQVSQGRNDNFIRPFTQRTPEPGDFGRNPQTNPNGFSRPRPQGRTVDPPNDQRRPSLSVFGFFRPQTPQLEDTDIIMPDSQRDNFDDENDVFGSTSPATTVRPTSTTNRPGPPPWATPPSLCVRRCPNTREFNPVCGSDRVTYNNPGRLRCEQQCGKTDVSINYYGTCVTTTTDFSISTPQTNHSTSS